MKNQGGLFGLVVCLLLASGLSATEASANSENYYTTVPPSEFFSSPQAACSYLILTGGGLFSGISQFMVAPVEVYECLGLKRENGARPIGWGGAQSVSESVLLNQLKPKLPPVPRGTPESTQETCHKTFLRNLAICNTAIALAEGWGNNVDAARTAIRESSQKCFDDEELILQGCLKH